MGMCSTILARRHIVNVENALDREWYLHVLIYIGEASTWILLFRKFYYLAVG
jgi:hypothetical protein